MLRGSMKALAGERRAGINARDASMRLRADDRREGANHPSISRRWSLPVSMGVVIPALPLADPEVEHSGFQLLGSLILLQTSCRREVDSFRTGRRSIEASTIEPGSA